MTTDYLNDGNDKAKSPRVRSVAYPSLTISEALDLTNLIYKTFGNITYTDRISIAKRLHISESHLQTKVSSCVQYGLLELKSKEGYRPSDLFIKTRNPLPEENIDDAYVELFSNPDLYKEIIENFNGKHLPEETGLATILYRKYKVAEKVSSFAARVFIKSAIEFGFLNEEGVFRLQKQSLKNEEIEVIESNIRDEERKENVLYLQPSTTKNEEIEKSEIPPIPIFLDNGTVAKLYMPKGFTKEDLKRVSKVLNGYVD